MKFALITALTLSLISCTPKDKAKEESSPAKNKTALLVIDIQNCFLPPTGSLAVSDGRATIDVANKLMELKGKTFDYVIATQDWHPANHVSFASQHTGKNPFDTVELNYGTQVLWPDHCVQNTEGAQFPQELNTAKFDHVVQKGDDPKIDSYSGFFANDKKKPTAMHELLQKLGVDKVYVLGLATDFCVSFTALDAKNLGYDTYFVEDGSRGVNATGVEVAGAVAKMKAAGIGVVQSSSLL